MFRDESTDLGRRVADLEEQVRRLQASATGAGSLGLGLFEAEGDLAVGLAAGTATRLPRGSPGQVLTVDLAGSPSLAWDDAAGDLELLVWLGGMR